MVEDAAAGIQAAKAGGMKSLAVGPIMKNLEQRIRHRGYMR